MPHICAKDPYISVQIPYSVVIIDNEKYGNCYVHTAIPKYQLL